MALTDADRRKRDVELLAVIVRSLTAILTAWTGFQSSKWSGVMSINFNMAGASRTESVRQANIAGQQVNLDVGVFLAWVEAVAEEAYAREARRSNQRSDNYVITTI